ncbi:MAG: GNAT family N-acetyltransferase [Dehalococcoidia bacterium]
MTVVERRTRALSRTAEYTVRSLHDRDEIRRILESRRPYAAYALGQLDPVLFRVSEWWLARGAGAARAIVLHSRGGLGNATFVMGEAGALDAVLRLHPGPRHAFLTCEVHHLETVLRYFELEQRQTMIRMQVTPQTFRPFRDEPVERLGGRDVRAVNRLYHTDGVPSFYSSRQIDDSVYFGAVRDGELVSIAGTHVISALSGIAVVGNVYTHPRFRGAHLAQATTSAVTGLLLRSCREVVLSVDPTNAPAVRAYERLGYIEVARLIEGAALRRDATGIVSAARRMLARMRGRPARAEVVRGPAD